MIGSHLARYAPDQPYVCFDVESGGPALNLGFALPWQISYAEATLRDGIKSIKTRLIRWPKLDIGPDNPSFVHFDRARYEREALDPRVVWDEFAPVLFSGKHRAVGHNVLAYDSYVLAVWQRLMGLRPDHSWMYMCGGLMDTNCLSKALKSQWTPDVSSTNAFVAWQYRAYHQMLPKGVKTKLGIMCKEMGVEYDEAKAHGSEYDVQCNVGLLREIVKKVEC